MKPGMAMMTEGEMIDITFDDDNLHVFDDAGHRMTAQD
jgi:sn-glycerol 3-phosphate transport system ATP-binding protein